jgi:F0F1-type ATP synthase membrane subunit b/b'
MAFYYYDGTEIKQIIDERDSVPDQVKRADRLYRETKDLLEALEDEHEETLNNFEVTRNELEKEQIKAARLAYELDCEK